jgi:hypothetical protein
MFLLCFAYAGALQGAKIMTIDQVEGNEPIHENFGTQLGNEIDEVSADMCARDPAGLSLCL